MRLNVVWAVVTSPQPVRFKLKHANVGASDLDGGDHDSQLRVLSLRFEALMTSMTIILRLTPAFVQ